MDKKFQYTGWRAGIHKKLQGLVDMSAVIIKTGDHKEYIDGVLDTIDFLEILLYKSERERQPLILPEVSHKSRLMAKFSEYLKELTETEVNEE